MSAQGATAKVRLPPAPAKKAPGQQEDEMAGFKGQATVALPRVFD
jgi:hypothetical protein